MISIGPESSGERDAPAMPACHARQWAHSHRLLASGLGWAGRGVNALLLNELK
jgi:hypothetical protein